MEGVPRHLHSNPCLGEVLPLKEAETWEPELLMIGRWQKSLFFWAKMTEKSAIMLIYSKEPAVPGFFRGCT